MRLSEEETKNKRNNIKQQENKNIDIKQEDKSLEEKNTIVDVKTEESTDFNTIEVLQNQIKLKDNQITILNNVITNNLKLLFIPFPKLTRFINVNITELLNI